MNKADREELAKKWQRARNWILQLGPVRAPLTLGQTRLYVQTPKKFQADILAGETAPQLDTIAQLANLAMEQLMADCDDQLFQQFSHAMREKANDTIHHKKTERRKQNAERMKRKGLK